MKANEFLDKLEEEGVTIYSGDRRAIEEIFNQAVEDFARIAEAPIEGRPHTEYSRGQMDAADRIAREIRAGGPKKKRERRLKEPVSIVITGPPYFEDNEACGYCNRPIGSKHEKWCRQ